MALTPVQSRLNRRVKVAFLVQHSIVVMKIYQLLFLLFATATGVGQAVYQPRDTSYSIHTTYLKVSKSHPDVRPVQVQMYRSVRRVANLVYTEVNGERPLHIDVFHRKGKRRKRPAVLLIHGGGWTSGAKENLIPMAVELAKRGYVTATVEYRLSAEAPYPAGVQDLKAAVRWLRANAPAYGIDPDRIAAYGCSAGAHLASLLGTTNELSLYAGNGERQQVSAAVQAVLNIDGIVSFIHPESAPERTGRAANAWLGKYENPNWREASPLEYAGADSPPFLFVNSAYPRFHGGRDDLFVVLDRYNIYHEAHTFAGAPHGFWLLEPWFKPTLKHSRSFLKRVFRH